MTSARRRPYTSKRSAASAADFRALEHSSRSMRCRVIAVNVAQLLKAPVGTVRSSDFSELVSELAAELGLQGPIEGSIRLMRTTHGILADCRYRAEIERECGRCLDPAWSVIEHEFRQEFLPSTDIITGLPDQTVADLEEPRIDPNHILDLTDEVRQDILLEQPLQPLCRTDCAGLCVECGQDLNDARCEHEDTVVSEEQEQPVGRLGELLQRQLRQN